MRKKRLLQLLAVVCVIPLALCSCTQVIRNTADELKMSRWGATLDNESEILLSFDDDFAVLKITNKDLETVCISGLCEVSDTDFVIHDEKTETAFAFSYIVYFDRVEIVYGKNTVSLYKS